MRLLRLAIPLAAVFSLSNLYALEIFEAIQQGDLEKLQQVIPPGKVDCYVLNYSDTPLCYAIKCNNLAMVRSLVEEHGADVISANSLSPLMHAAAFGTLPIV